MISLVIAPNSVGTRRRKHVLVVGAGGNNVVALVSTTVSVFATNVLVTVTVTWVVDVSVSVVLSVTTVAGVMVVHDPVVIVVVFGLSVVVEGLTPRQAQAVAKSYTFGQLLQKRVGILVGMLIVGHFVGRAFLLNSVSDIVVTVVSVIVTGDGVSSTV